MFKKRYTLEKQGDFSLAKEVIFYLLSNKVLFINVKGTFQPLCHLFALVASFYSTLKPNIILASKCSAIWQCAIHVPGLVISTRSSTVEPFGISTVSFQTKLSFCLPSIERIKNRCPWM